MPSAANHQGIVGEFHIVWRMVTLWVLKWCQCELGCVPKGLSVD